MEAEVLRLPTIYMQTIYTLFRQLQTTLIDTSSFNIRMLHVSTLVSLSVIIQIYLYIRYYDFGDSMGIPWPHFRHTLPRPHSLSSLSNKSLTVDRGQRPWRRFPERRSWPSQKDQLPQLFGVKSPTVSFAAFFLERWFLFHIIIKGFPLLHSIKQLNK